MQSVLLATGNDPLNEGIHTKILPKTEMQCIGSISYKHDLSPIVKQYHPDIVIVSKLLSGTDVSFVEEVLASKVSSPTTRFIYLAGAYDKKDKEKMMEFSAIISAGIYDIFLEKTISPKSLMDLLLHPKTKEDVAYLCGGFTSDEITENEVISFEDDTEEAGGNIEEVGFDNLIMFSSIKPGTGKSFISVNTAIAAAKYGKTKEGNTPKVAIIEGDLQNLSVGILLGYEQDEKKNLKNVLDKIATGFTSDEQIIPDPVIHEQIRTYIINSFRSYSEVPNLYALVGSQFRVEDLENVKACYFNYLFEVVREEFDLVIVDSNSSLYHASTIPLLELSSRAFYILNLDYNNVCNNKRYQQTLDSIGITRKVSYILNEDIDRDYRMLTNQKLLEPLLFDSEAIKEAGFELIAKVPEVPKEIFLNRLFSAKPVMLDTSDATLKARLELCKITSEFISIPEVNRLDAAHEKYVEKIRKYQKKRGA